MLVFIFNIPKSECENLPDPEWIAKAEKLEVDYKNCILLERSGKANKPFNNGVGDSTIIKVSVNYQKTLDKQDSISYIETEIESDQQPKSRSLRWQDRKAKRR